MLLIKNKPLRMLLGVLETGNFLLLKLMWKNPAQARKFPGIIFRSYMSLVGRERWVCRPIFDFLPVQKNLQITLEHLSCEFIDTPLEQLACLALITKATAPRVIFEIGTFRGRTALNFALNSPDDCEVYTMDLPPKARDEAVQVAGRADAVIIEASETGIEYRGRSIEHKIKQLYANSQTFDFSPYHGRVDIVYIDGAHHYECVMTDTANALKMVRPGGYVLWDEFANYGDYNDVTRAVLAQVSADEVVQIENTQLGLYRRPEEP